MAKRWLEAVAFWGLLALLWEFGVGWLGVRRYLLPPFSDVLIAGWNAREPLLSNTWVTTVEVLVGFDVTPAMAEFNRNGNRFRANAGTGAAQPPAQ